VHENITGLGHNLSRTSSRQISEGMSGYLQGNNKRKHLSDGSLDGDGCHASNPSAVDDASYKPTSVESENNSYSKKSFSSDSSGKQPKDSISASNHSQRIHSNQLNSPSDGDIFLSAIRGPPITESTAEPNAFVFKCKDDDLNQDIGDTFALEDFQVRGNGKMKNNSQVETIGCSDVDADADDGRCQQRPPLVSLYVPETTPFSSTQEKKSQPRNASEHSKSVATTVSNADSSSLRRIDRLENVMEQLVLLNAAQAQRQVGESIDRKPSSDSQSQHASASTHEIADKLKQELIEIRAKMDEREKEDAALRQEIKLLRDQLAERRSTDVGSTSGNSFSAASSVHPPPTGTSTPFFRVGKRKNKHPILDIFNIPHRSNKGQQYQEEEISGGHGIDTNEASLEVLEKNRSPRPRLGGRP